MKILIDATNIKVGGGVQVAVSVISELYNTHNQSHKFLFFVSDKVFVQLSEDLQQKASVVTTGVSNLLPFGGCNKQLIEASKEVDCTFTIFGPSYWNPKSKHVIGFANAWLVSKNTPAYSIFPWTKRHLYKFKNYLLGKLLYSKGKFYITETESVKAAFIDCFDSEKEYISVVSNTLPYIYKDDYEQRGFFSEKLNECNAYFKFVSITHNYPHKNLNIIADVGALLDKHGVEAIFIVTFADNEYERQSEKFKKYTLNVGPVDIYECRELYQNADALFLPTLIECFSVSYLEAMANNLCITTSDYDFAKDVCGDSAIYFDPLSPDDIANKLLRVIKEESLRHKLTLKGARRLSKFPDNEMKVKSYLNIIERFVRD
ncbi:glycosyltransferase [Vibrio breoganii]